MTTEVAKVDHQEQGFCLGCGYALRGLTETRCPECGRAFDPFDPRTMRVPGFPKRPPPKPLPFAVVIVLWSVLAALLMLVGMLSSTWAMCAGALAGWIGIFIAARLRIAKERRAAARGEPLAGTRHWRSVAVILFVLPLLTGFGHQRCPHGRYYRYGPVTLFRDTQGGGPCRNYVNGTRFEAAKGWYLIVS